MAIKGNAKIELINADGSKQIVEHGNMLTDAVRDLLCTSRGEMSNIMRISNNNDSFVRQIFGGILLFNEVLNTDPADYYLPSLKITGYASQEAYSGLDVVRGSYNDVESGLQEDGSYRLVWDFTTSQANGTIKSIALCPNLMGQIGASNTVVDSERKALNIDVSPRPPFDNGYGRMLGDNDIIDGLPAYSFRLVGTIGNIGYAVSSYNIGFDSSYSSRSIGKNGWKLKIYRFNLGLTGVSLSNMIGRATYMDCIEVQLPTDFTSKLPTSMVNWVDYTYDSEGKKLIIYPCVFASELKRNSSFNYIEIDFANNMNVTTYGYTYIGNDTYASNNNNQLKPAYSDTGAHKLLHITDKYIAVVGKGAIANTYMLFVGSRNDYYTIRPAQDENGNEIILGTNNTNARIQPVCTIGNIFVYGTTQGYQYNEFTKAFMTDLSTGLTKEINAKKLSYLSNVKLNNKVTWARTGKQLTVYPIVNPFVLTTKNNLDTPVVKTSTQAMKITYTLTESEG